jgi:hypothetical protein
MSKCWQSFLKPILSIEDIALLCSSLRQYERRVYCRNSVTTGSNPSACHTNCDKINPITNFASMASFMLSRTDLRTVYHERINVYKSFVRARTSKHATNLRQRTSLGSSDAPSGKFLAGLVIFSLCCKSSLLITLGTPQS